MTGYDMTVHRWIPETRWWKRLLGYSARRVVVFKGVVTDMQWQSSVNSGSYAAVTVTGEDALSIASRYFMPKGEE
jgi:hypothetical protein